MKERAYVVDWLLEKMLIYWCEYVVMVLAVMERTDEALFNLVREF